VIIPLVVTSWPTILPAILGAAGALGFKVTSAASETRGDLSGASAETGTTVEVKNAEVIGEELGAGQSLTVERDGVTLRFAADSRGRCRVHVEGPGRSKAELQRIGEEAARKVVQMYSYHRVMSQAQELGYELVEEQVDEQGGVRIRLKRN
jgi:hypothetical protein